MTLDAFLALLSQVRERKNGWWEACCPAHDDRSPSLKIRAGDRGLIIKCWTGCSTVAVCEALGIKVKDLFYDGKPDAAAYRKRKAQQLAVYEQRRREGQRIDRLREADYFVRSRRGLDISGWRDAQLDAELGLLATAYILLEGDPTWLNS